MLPIMGRGKNQDSKAYRRMLNEEEPDTNVPSGDTGSLLRRKWGKQRRSSSDISNSNRSTGNNSQDRSLGETKSQRSLPTSFRITTPHTVDDPAESMRSEKRVIVSKSDLNKVPMRISSDSKSSSKQLDFWDGGAQVELHQDRSVRSMAESDSIGDPAVSSTDDVVAHDEKERRVDARHRSRKSAGPKKYFRDSTTTLDTRQTETTIDSTQLSSITSSTMVSSLTCVDASSAIGTQFRNERQGALISACNKDEHQQCNHSISGSLGETEEDRMIQLAMEMSLRSFHEYERPRQAHAHFSPATEHRKSDDQLRNALDAFYRQASQRNLKSEERRVPQTSTSRSPSAHMYEQFEYARKNLPKEDAEAIQRALLETGDDFLADQFYPVPEKRLHGHPPISHSSSQLPHHTIVDPRNQIATETQLSSAEVAAIELAIQKAEEEEQQKSFMVAVELQTEEASLYSLYMLRQQQQQHQQHQFQQLGTGNIGLQEALSAGVRHSTSPSRHHVLDVQQEQTSHAPRVYLDQPQTPRRKSSPPPPNILQSEIQLNTDEDLSLHSNSSFSQLTRSTITPRDTARSSVTSLSRRSAMDEAIRVQISLAIKGNHIQKGQRVVKEGKKTRLYHATGGANSGGHDVAIKVFKCVGEVQGNPKRLKVLAKKELSNLLRANKARVPVPTPISQTDNVIFMRFIGEHRWPAPQLSVIELRKGSRMWNMLYSQSMVAVRRLYVHANLVHGDLSEAHILVCPSYLVDSKDNSDASSSSPEESTLQAVLIDFGSAVDSRHHSATELLKKDLSRIRSFFMRQGIKTLGLQMAFEFVVAPELEEGHEVIVNDGYESHDGPASSVNDEGGVNRCDVIDDEMFEIKARDRAVVDKDKESYAGKIQTHNLAHGLTRLCSQSPTLDSSTRSGSDNSINTPNTLQTTLTGKTSNTGATAKFHNTRGQPLCHSDKVQRAGIVEDEEMYVLNEAFPMPFNNRDNISSRRALNNLDVWDADWDDDVMS